MCAWQAENSLERAMQLIFCSVKMMHDQGADLGTAVASIVSCGFSLTTCHSSRYGTQSSVGVWEL